MQHAGPAGRGYGLDVAFRAAFAEHMVDRRVKIIWQTGNRRIVDDFRHRHAAENLFDGRQANQLFLIVKQSADRRVGDLVFAELGDGFDCQCIGAKNFIGGKFAYGMGRCD